MMEQLKKEYIKCTECGAVLFETREKMKQNPSIKGCCPDGDYRIKYELVRAACEWYLHNMNAHIESYEEWCNSDKRKHLPYLEWLFRKAFAGVLE